MSEKQAKRKRRAEGAARRDADAGGQGARASWSPGHDDQTWWLLGTALSAAVPLQVFDFYQQGGPSMVEVEEARAFGRVLAEHGDKLLFRSKKQGETAELFTRLARALAALSFQPSGVPLFFGQRFDAVEILAWSIGEEAARVYCRQVTGRYYAELPQVSATFTPSGGEEPALTCNVTWWFDLASNEDLLRLRTEGYSNLNPAENKRGPQSMAESIMEQVAVRNEEVAALRERAQKQGRHLVCCIEASQAEYWLSIHRRRLRGRASPK
jgi:hypothetical protein